MEDEIAYRPDIYNKLIPKWYKKKYENEPKVDRKFVEIVKRKTPRPPKNVTNETEVV